MVVEKENAARGSQEVSAEDSEPKDKGISDQEGGRDSQPTVKPGSKIKFKQPITFRPMNYEYLLKSISYNDTDVLIFCGYGSMAREFLNGLRLEYEGKDRRSRSQGSSSRTEREYRISMRFRLPLASRRTFPFRAKNYPRNYNHHPRLREIRKRRRLQSLTRSLATMR